MHYVRLLFEYEHKRKIYFTKPKTVIYKIVCLCNVENDTSTKDDSYAWRSDSVMDFHATVQGSIPGGNGVFTELHVLRKGQYTWP